MIRMLLVDDHEIVRRGLKQLLAEAFPTAVFGEAGSLPLARQLIREESWCLVLLDISLPSGSGLDLITELRQQSPQTKVMVLSTYSEEEFAIRAFKLGAVGYLAKGSVADEIVAAVDKVLAGGRYVSVALAELLAETLSNPSTCEPHETLSPRELEVLKLVALGKTIKEIASMFSLSEKTIATYRSRISAKLGQSTNVELARYALQHKLVD